MKHICMYCGIQTKPDDNLTDPRVSHGICPKCFKSEMVKVNKIKTDTRKAIQKHDEG